MDRADVIFMPMCDDDADHVAGSGAQIFIIGNDVINSNHIVSGEHDAGIYHQNLVLEFIGGHVLAYFPEPPQGNNLQFSLLTHKIVFPLKLLNYLSAISGKGLVIELIKKTSLTCSRGIGKSRAIVSYKLPTLAG